MAELYFVAWSIVSVAVGVVVGTYWEQSSARLRQEGPVATPRIYLVEQYRSTAAKLDGGNFARLIRLTEVAAVNAYTEGGFLCLEDVEGNDVAIFPIESVHRVIVSALRFEITDAG